MLSTIISYVLLIASVVFIGTDFHKITNKPLRSIFKVVASTLLVVSVGYAIWKIDFPIILVILIEAVCVGILVIGLTKGKLYGILFDEIRRRSVHSGIFVKYWKEWIGHVILISGILLFVALVILIPVLSGKIIAPFFLSAVVVAIVVMFSMFCYCVIYGIIKLLSNWGKWIIR